MTAKRKAKRARRSIVAKPPVPRGRVEAGVERCDEATERTTNGLPPLERDVDSDESTQLAALFDERSRRDGDAIVDDPEGTNIRHPR
jgi:hypothetical protein